MVFVVNVVAFDADENRQKLEHTGVFETEAKACRNLLNELIEREYITFPEDEPTISGCFDENEYDVNAFYNMLWFNATTCRNMSVICESYTDSYYGYGDGWSWHINECKIE